jgi:hypothetical protein
MTYSVGGLIQATDYNGFVSTTAGANVNATWSTGATNAGWGQTALGTVSAGGIVTATQWASLVNTLSSMGSQTGTTITARTAPTAGQTIAVLAAVNTDLTNCYTNRGNAVNSGTQYGTFSGTTSKTTATGSGNTAWTITFTHTVTFPSADQARYFFNAGGIIRINYGKSSTGTDHDADWNTFAGQVGSINITGGAQTIAAQAYTGTTRLNASGGTQTTLATSTGWYALTPGAAATTLFQLNNVTAPYQPEYIRTTAAVNAGSTTLTLVTTWVDDGTGVVGSTSNISGGTAVSSPATSIGAATAPTTLVTYIPPSTAFLTNTWGTPTIAASVA